MTYKYELDTRQIEITDPDEEGNYTVLWEGLPVGFIYVSDIDTNLGSPIWNGSTPYLNLHAQQIGEYIEASDL